MYQKGVYMYQKGVYTYNHPFEIARPLPTNLLIYFTLLYLLRNPAQMFQLREMNARAYMVALVMVGFGPGAVMELRRERREKLGRVVGGGETLRVCWNRVRGITPLCRVCRFLLRRIVGMLGAGVWCLVLRDSVLVERTRGVGVGNKVR